MYVNMNMRMSMSSVPIYNHYLKETKDAQRRHYGFIEIWQCKYVCQQKYDESVLISSVLLWVAKDHLLPNLQYVGWRREDEDREEEVIGYDAGGERTRTRTRWGQEKEERRIIVIIIIVILCISYFLKSSSLKRSNDWYSHAIDGHLGTNPVEYVPDTCT
jgi:hypothetical protein